MKNGTRISLPFNYSMKARKDRVSVNRAISGKVAHFN